MRTETSESKRKKPGCRRKKEEETTIDFWAGCGRKKKKRDPDVCIRLIPHAWDLIKKGGKFCLASTKEEEHLAWKTKGEGRSPFRRKRKEKE